MSDSGSMIRIVEATKRYGNGGPGVEALKGVSLDIARGECVAIMGPSGCGKSTLLHVLGGLDRLSGGEVWVDEEPLHQLSDNALTQLRRRKIGFVFQFFNLLPTLTVLENVEMPALIAGDSEITAQRRAKLLLREVDLEEKSSRRLHQLSGGEMQRAALARALMMEPPVLLADEPTGNLDSHASEKVVSMLRSLGKQHQTTIVLVTHSREVAASADRVITMRDGQIE